MAATTRKDRIGPDDLGLDLSKGTDTQLFRWLVACDLFGRRISQDIAAAAFKELDKARLLNPKKLADADWQQLVDLLGAGGYKRYDESTASELIRLGQDAQDRYGGRLTKITRGDDGRTVDKTVIKKRVQEFKGIGPTAAAIFVRELHL
ncbi:DNA methylase [Microlunatus sp. Gsoil 973]|uniref:DNA methylase n=1 Tax=Microlunatus sp. Gsoil 973 TaxID=2672569 RepID=UPI0012B4D3EC|nr:DNA methylase [Microlunatus sp. Gsoil 973]QGN34845.1 DNA methylase [Microlunatus sp. Gsoil 973]